MVNPHQTQEFWIATACGRIFAKTWSFGANCEPGKEPVILFHDSLGCVELWRDFPMRLARATRRPIIAYDRLGFGRSDKHPGRLGLSFVQDEAHGSFAALRNHLGIKNFIAFGHSVGGEMAVFAAGAFPEHCRALITESAQAFVEDRTLEGIREAERGFGQHDQMDRLRRYHGDKAEWVLNSWTGTWLSEEFSSWTLDDSLRNVHCPVLVLHGENDDYGSTQHAKRIASLTSGPALLKILPDCGHIPHREKQRSVLDAVSEFLAQRRA